MTTPVTRVMALVPVPRERGAMGLPAAWNESWAGGSVLGAVVKRLSRCRGLEGIVLIVERGAELPGDLIQDRVHLHEVQTLWDDFHSWAQAARKWSMTCWRGGLSGATCWDEVLLPGLMAQILGERDASAALLAGPDWPLIDPELCDRVIELHRQAPQSNRFTFSQAPPGLCGGLIERGLLEDMHRLNGLIGLLLDYQPRFPQPDPIGRDPCVLIDPLVRDTIGRFVWDAPRWKKWLHRIATGLGSRGVPEASAAQVAEAGRASLHEVLAFPQQITIELDPRRRSSGPLAQNPGAGRGPMSLDHLADWLAGEPDAPDLVVNFGGAGEPMMHPDWRRAIELACSAGVLGVHWTTDLLEEKDAVVDLARSGLDVVSVRLPADQPETYRQLMGVDGFAQVTDNVQLLLQSRRAAGRGLPHVAVRLAKTRQNTGELASFFDRWTVLAGHAVIDPPFDAAGTLGGLNVIDMSPPRRRPCRQLAGRLTVLSDGRAALCDQDVRGEGLADRPAEAQEAWRGVQQVLARHREEGGGGLPGICRGCSAWHRP